MLTLYSNQIKHSTKIFADLGINSKPIQLNCLGGLSLICTIYIVLYQLCSYSNRISEVLDFYFTIILSRSFRILCFFYFLERNPKISFTFLNKVFSYKEVKINQNISNSKIISYRIRVFFLLPIMFSLRIFFVC